MKVVVVGEFDGEQTVFHALHEQEAAHDRLPP